MFQIHFNFQYVLYSCTLKTAEEKTNSLKFTKLMIFMQQMQYSASNRMHVFQKFSGVTPQTPFSAGTLNH